MLKDTKIKKCICLLCNYVTGSQQIDYIATGN